MIIITTKIVVNNDRKIQLDLPPDSPIGPATVTLTFQPKAANSQMGNRAAEVYGQGQVWMAKDFDAPLDDFAEYI